MIGKTLVCKYGHVRTPENTYVEPKTGHQRCRICTKDYQNKNREKLRELERQRYAANPEKFIQKHNRWVENDPEKWRRTHRLRKFHLSPERYAEMFASQKGLCATCSRVMNPPYIDHNHRCCDKQGSCGKCVRGLLCMQCNAALGHTKENIETLERMIVYIRSFEPCPTM